MNMKQYMRTIGSAALPGMTLITAQAIFATETATDSTKFLP